MFDALMVFWFFVRRRLFFGYSGEDSTYSGQWWIEPKKQVAYKCAARAVRLMKGIVTRSTGPLWRWDRDGGVRKICTLVQAFRKWPVVHAKL